jgi:membrane associated rhomboid family serine protease
LRFKQLRGGRERSIDCLAFHLDAPKWLSAGAFARIFLAMPRGGIPKFHGFDRSTLHAATGLSMHFDVPDPRYTSSADSHALLRLAVRLSVCFVVLLWLIHIMNWGLDLDPSPFGVRPREWSGLIGIVTAPLVHSGFAHLVANSVPLATVGAAMLFLYPRSTLRVLPAVYLGPGVLVWLFGRGSVHLGASGLVYGLVSYVFMAGLLRRDRRAIAASLLVVFMYGSLAWGVLPIQSGVSWETHLSAALIGALLALAFRRLDIPPLKRYVWEEQAEEDDQEPPAADDDAARQPKDSILERLH